MNPPRPPLHLIDQASPQAYPAALALIARHHKPTLLLGGTPLFRAAEAAGLTEQVKHVRVAVGSARWGVFALRQALRDVEPGRELHAWSLNCLAALRTLRRTSATVMHLLALPQPDQLKLMLRLDRPTLRWRVLGASLRDQLVTLGVPAERIELETLPAPEEAQKKLQHDRVSLRARWGVNDAMPVVAVLSDPTTAGDAGPMMIALNLIGLAADRPLRLLVHPEQSGRERSQTLLDRYGKPDRFIQDAGVATPWSVVRGCDAVMLSESPAPLSVRYALAAGLPIVAPDLPHHREALADAPEERVHFALTAEPKRMADRLQHRALGLITAEYRYASGQVD